MTDTTLRRLCWTLILLFSWSSNLGVSAQVLPEFMQAAKKKNCGDDNPKTLLYISNESNTMFDVFWVNPHSQTLTPISVEPVKPRIVSSYNSNVGQMLELHEVPDDTTGECMSKDQVCRRAYVKVNGEDKVKNVYKLNNNFETIQVTEDLIARAYSGELIESKITFTNQSINPVDIYWVDHTGAKAKQTATPLPIGSALSLNSYVGNEFQIEQVGDCEEEEEKKCPVINFKNPGNEAKILINTEFQAMNQGEIIAEPDSTSSLWWRSFQ